MDETPDNSPPEAQQPPDAGPQSQRPDGGATEAHAADPGGPRGPSAAQAPDQDGPRRLTRSSGDRMLSGVCGGIAAYVGVDATVVRIAAVVLTLIGGAGALLYLAALLLMPADAEPEGAAPGNRKLVILGVGALLLIGWPLALGGGFLVAGLAVPLATLALVGLLVWWLVSGEGPAGSGRDVARRAALGVGVLMLCGAVAVGGGLAAGLGGGTVVAGLVLASGVALVAGAFLGGVRWLIPPALSLAVAVGFVAAAGIDLDGGVGERDYRPTSAGELREGYRLGMGELVVDLRGVSLPAGDTPLNLDLGVGEARLYVPDDVCVASTATVGMGLVDLFGREHGGIDLDWDDRPRAAPGNSRLVVDANVGVGALLVRYERYDEDGHRFGRASRLEHQDQNAGCRGARVAR